MYCLLCRCLSERGADISGAAADAALARLSAAASHPDDDGLKLAACRALAAAAAGGAVRGAAAVAALVAAEAPRAKVHKKKGLAGALGKGAREAGPARDDGGGGAVVAGHRGPLGAARRCPGTPPPWGRSANAANDAAALQPAQLLAGACSADAVAARHALAVRAPLADVALQIA